MYINSMIKECEENAIVGFMLYSVEGKRMYTRTVLLCADEFKIVLL